MTLKLIETFDFFLEDLDFFLEKAPSFFDDKLDIDLIEMSFNLIEDLTEDNHPLVSKNGKVSRRKNASFIKLIEYKNDWGKIMNKVLYQIPRQFIDYCSIYGVEPKK